MEAKPPPYPEYREQWEQPTFEYRVVLWEQPVIEDTDPEIIGWGESTIDLVGVQDVHEAIEWAKRQLAENAGPFSSAGAAVRDSEYVLLREGPGRGPIRADRRMGPVAQPWERESEAFSNVPLVGLVGIVAAERAAISAPARRGGREDQRVRAFEPTVVGSGE